MIVEQLLDWAATTLREADSDLTTGALADRLSQQFHASLDKLEVLLSLDSRFERTTNGNWQLGPVQVTEEESSEMVNRALTLRERAVEALLQERQVVENEVVARKGNAQSYEPAFTEPLGEGTEFQVVDRRGDWILIRLAGDQEGWIEDDTALVY